MSDTTKETICQYEALLERALSIVDEEPYWLGAKFAYEKRPANITINGADATLTVSYLESGYYDSGDTLREGRCRFPAEMLTWPEERFQEWKMAMGKQYQEKQAERSREAAAVREAKERSIYEAMKRKYEK